jgi:hypothetical protein
MLYLGYIVGNGQLKIDPAKVEVIVKQDNYFHKIQELLRSSTVVEEIHC